MLDASSSESDDCELPEAGANMLMALLIRFEWCCVPDNASKPSERLLLRDDPMHDGVGEKAWGEGISTLGLDARRNLPFRGAVGASKSK